MKKNILILIILFSSFALAQDYKSLVQGFENQNILSNSVYRISNTYLFNSVANFSDTIFDTQFNINHIYNGNGIITNQTIFKDDENFKFILQKSIIDKLKISIDNEFIYSAANSNDWNNLTRNRSYIGLNYNFLDSGLISSAIGYEYTNQISKKISGLSYRMYGIIPELMIWNNKINSSAYFSQSNLENKIKYKDLDFNGGIFNNFLQNDFFQLNYKYKTLSRDYFTLSGLTDPNASNIRIEERADDRIALDGSIKNTYSENFSSFLTFGYNNRIVERGLRQQTDQINTPKKILEENSLNAKIDLSYRVDNFNQQFAFDYAIRNENNNLNFNYLIDTSQTSFLLSSEKQKDIKTTKSNFISKSIINFETKDSIIVNYSATIFRNDTPSELNMDDRDEFFSLFNLEYNHKFESGLKAGFIFESIQNHLVFLSASRSSSNNWNRIYRMSPYLLFSTEDFSMQPQFEVLANYTIYDYEVINPSIKSYSYRQIGYKDTVFFKINNNYNIQLKINARLYERGVLYWKEFAESPQNRNLEIFSKMIFFTKPLYNMQVGLGARFFYLSQQKIDKTPISNLNNDFINKIWGPEAIIITNLFNGNNLSLQGWLEYRLFNNQTTITPNFFINCNILL